jgi:hypothetical protein
MRDKYIIKNCPAIFRHPVGHWNCQQGKECQDCTDCVLKQIVKQAGYCLCPEILELLDIQEVE